MKGAVVGVVADGQGLAGRAEQHLLVGDQAAQPHRVDGMPRGPAPPRAPSTTSLVVGSARPVAGRRGHALGGAHRGARRRVDLAVVVQLDDLGRLEVRRGQLGEAHHEHRADGEVGRDDGS